MNLFRCFFLFLCGIGTQSLIAQLPPALTKKYAPAVLREDVKLMQSIYFAMHPAIGIYETRSKLDGLFSNLLNQLNDSLTEKQFRIRLKLLADELHCGHTEVILSSQYQKAIRQLKVNYSPYYFLPINNRLFVIGSIDKKKDTLLKQGQEISRLNGIKIDTSFGLIRKMISTDGYIKSGKDLFLQLGFSAYHLSLFGRPDTMVAEVITANQSTSLVKFKSFRSKDIPPFSLRKSEDSLYKKYRRAAMSFRYLDSNQTTLHLRIHSFSGSRYGKAYRRIFKRLAKNNTKNLVIDLRNNGGGSLTNSYRLLSYLLNAPAQQTLKTGIRRYPFKKYTKGQYLFRLTRFGLSVIGKHRRVNDTDFYTYTINPRSKNHFNGKVMVLINGASFSASCLVSAYLKYQQRATFIGQETSGAYEGCNAGITPFYTLPNTKIKLRVPAFRVMHDPVLTTTGHGILPDYPIQYELNDFIAKRNLELEKVKQLLNIR